MAKSRILIIEDNEDTVKFLTHILSTEYDVIAAENAILGLDFARNRSPDLILLDIMLPHLNGHEACQMLRKDPNTQHIPIIMVSAKNRANDISQGLDLGADDYIAKPFDAKELLARIRARLRAVANQPKATDTLIFGDLRIDISNRKVYFKNKEADLTITEFDILRCLVQNEGEVVNRKQIIAFLGGGEKKEINNRTIDVHIRSIRKKIPDIERNLSSVYGVGYRYNR